MSNEYWNPRRGKNWCPCCGLYDVGDPQDEYSGICNICWWHDDERQRKDPDFVSDNTENDISLNQAKELFKNGKNTIGEKMLFNVDMTFCEASQIYYSECICKNVHERKKLFSEYTAMLPILYCNELERASNFIAMTDVESGNLKQEGETDE
jgi:hypothetical protein